MPWIQVVVMSITASSLFGPDSVVRNPRKKNSSGKTEDTPFQIASICTVLNNSKNRNVATRSNQNFQNDNVLALISIFDQ